MSKLQDDFLDWKFGIFLHFNLATFCEREWATGCEDPALFAPSRLDCDQWIDAAVAAGMGYAVLTVKHTCGFCLWESRFTLSHDMAAFTAYRNGKGDIVREFVDACRRRGVKVGLYYCFPGDFAAPLLPKGAEDRLHGLAPEAQGRYAEFIKEQLGELLTGYGTIDLLWIDQYANPYTYKDWPGILRHIKSIQPGCVVIANNSLDSAETDIHSYEYPFLTTVTGRRPLPPDDNRDAAEVSDTIGKTWFWSEKENATTIKSAEEIVRILRFCNDRQANYLLNVAPDRSGLIPEYSVERLRQVGRLLGRPL